MDDTPQYLVEFRIDGERQYEPCLTVDVALALIRSRAETGNFDCELWQRVPFSVNVDVQLGGAPRRKRKDSTGTAASDGPPPSRPESAAAPVDVRSEGAAVPHAADAAVDPGKVVHGPGGDAATPTAGTQSGQSRPSCGGKACETRGGVDVHRMDASCAKFTGTRKGAAAR